MASSRTLFAIVGFGVAVAGIGVAWTVDRLIGMALLIVGGFLLILPFSRVHDDE